MRPHQDLSDEAVLLAYAESKADSYFTELYERFRLPLVKYFRKAWPSRPAEDLVQETFMKIIRKADQYKAGFSVQNWIFTAAIRLNYDLSETRAVDQLPEDMVGDPGVSERLDDVEEVEFLLSKLPPSQEKAVRNYYFDQGESHNKNRSHAFRQLRNFSNRRVTK